MSAATEYLDRAMLNHVFRGVTLPAPAAVYVGLFTSDPSNADAEVTGEGYARRQVRFSEPAIGDAGAYEIANEEDVNFPRAKGFWGRISHFAIFDAADGGNILTTGAFADAKLIEKDDLFQAEKGRLRVVMPPKAAA